MKKVFSIFLVLGLSCATLSNDNSVGESERELVVPIMAPQEESTDSQVENSSPQRTSSNEDQGLDSFQEIRQEVEDSILEYDQIDAPSSAVFSDDPMRDYSVDWTEGYEEGALLGTTTHVRDADFEVLEETNADLMLVRFLPQARDLLIQLSTGFAQSMSDKDRQLLVESRLEDILKLGGFFLFVPSQGDSFRVPASPTDAQMLRKAPWFSKAQWENNGFLGYFSPQGRKRLIVFQALYESPGNFSGVLVMDIGE